MSGLELGGGPHPRFPHFEQFDAIDWKYRTKLDYRLGDARQLPYREREFDVVYASNLLEHFPAEETLELLQEWMRVGEQLQLVVPDSVGILRDHFTGINNWDDCAERLRGSRDYPGNEHLACFTITEFPQIAAAAGLKLLSLASSHAGGGFDATLVRP